MTLKEDAKKFLRQVGSAVFRHTNAAGVLQKTEAHPWRILMYHRVIAPEDSTYPLQPGMYVLPETFSMQMELLQKEANVLSLDELAESIAQDRKLPDKSVAITFDDGWADTYQHAFPVLKELKLPATFFLATSFIGTNDTLWADKVALAICALWQEPQHLKTAASRIEDCQELGEEFSKRLAGVLRVSEEDDTTSVLDKLVEELKLIDHKERVCVVNTLTNLAKEFGSFKPERSFLSWDEVHEMAEVGMSFGSHSHLHQNFAQLSEAQIRDELENAQQRLREENITPSSVFCYPGGCYSGNSQKVLTERGISFALSTERKPRLDTTPLLLGRIGIHEDISNSPSLFTSRVWAESVL